MKIFSKSTISSTKTSAVIVAKAISLIAFLFVLSMCFAEIMAFASYVIPLATLSMYQMFESIQTANNAINSSVSLYTVIFPSIFIVIVLGLLHYWFIKYIIKKTALWMLEIMRK